MTLRQHLRYRALLKDRENLHGDGNTIAAREGFAMAAVLMSAGCGALARSILQMIVATLSRTRERAHTLSHEGAIN
jgi:hypothetical protein